MAEYRNINPLDEIVKTRCYYSPKDHHDPFQIIGVFTTEVMVHRNDLAFTNSETFKQMITDAINYDGDLRDNKILNSLDLLLPTKEEVIDGKKTQVKRPSLYFTLGTYKYLADEVSRTKGAKTFLEAARGMYAKMELDEKLPELKNGQAYNLRKEWFIETLKELKLYQYPHIQTFVHDWLTKASFEVCGETQSQDGGRAIGAYPELAKIICDPKQPYAQISDCVAAALGSKEKFIGKSPEFVHNFIKSTVQSVYKLDTLKNDVKFTVAEEQPLLKPIFYTEQAQIFSENQKGIKVFLDNLKDIFYKTHELSRDINTGYEIRRNRLVNKIRNKIYSQEGEVTTLSTEGQKIFKDIFSFFPQELTASLHAMNYRFGYTDSPNIEPMYPLEHPGWSDIEIKNTKASIASCFGRYQLIILSNGNNRENKPINLAQTGLHEVFHRIAHHSIVENNAELKEIRDEIFKDAKHLLLKNNNPNIEPDWLIGRMENIKCTTLPPSTIKDILYAYSKSYNTYSNFNKDEKEPQLDKNGKPIIDLTVGEEICANIFGLSHTEFSERNRPNNNPFITNYSAKDEVYKLTSRINHFVKTVCLEINLQQAKELGQTR